MKQIPFILIVVPIVSFGCIKTYGQNTLRFATLDEVVNVLSLKSSAAQIEKLNYQNKLLQFENPKKSFLPSFSLNFNPININNNHSVRLLQQPVDGGYTYVEDYSNNSSTGISVRQKVTFIGGEVNIGSNINYLNEFSRKIISFSATPLSIGCSQQLWGGGKHYRLEKEIESAENNTAIEQCAMQHHYAAIRDSYNSYFTIKTKALYDFKRNVELEKILLSRNDKRN